jgi:hypothetical protein
METIHLGIIKNAYESAHVLERADDWIPVTAVVLQSGSRGGAGASSGSA